MADTCGPAAVAVCALRTLPLGKVAGILTRWFRRAEIGRILLRLGDTALPMKAANTARAHRTRKRTRIQAVNEERILDAGLHVFSAYGFRGSTVDQIAAAAGMTKPNLLYYFRRKRDIYLAVLNRTHEMWLQPLEELTHDGDPVGEIAAYI